MDFSLVIKRFFLVLAFVQFFSLSSWAQKAPGELDYLDDQFACTDNAKAQKYIQDFKVDTEGFGGLELCKAQVDLKKLLNDLDIIENGHFTADSQIPNKYVKGFIPSNNYYGWMKGETRGMTRGNDVPFATAYNSMGYFTMQDGWAKLSTLGRVGTVIHEARHTAGYRHIPCNQGPYSGSRLDGCDSEYTYGGSHAIEMEYYGRVSVLGQNFHPVYKQMARLMGIARSNFVFNKQLIAKREGLLLVQENDHKAILVDGQTVAERELPKVQGVVKRTSFGASVFNGFNGYAVEMYENTRTQHPDLLDVYSYYKLLTVRPNAKNAVKDFEEFDNGVKRFAVLVDDKDQIATYDFPNGKWKSPTTLSFAYTRSATQLENGQTGYFIISNNNEIHPYNPTTNKVEDALKGQLWQNENVSFAQLQNKVLALKTDGQVYFKNSANQWQLWEGANSRYSSMLNVPLYDGYDVKL
jgi:hypothetical protein